MRERAARAAGQIFAIGHLINRPAGDVKFVAAARAAPVEVLPEQPAPRAAG